MPGQLRGGPKNTGTPRHMTAKPGQLQVVRIGSIPMIGSGGRENLYAHSRMETRPLPSIPNIAKASTSCEESSTGGAEGSRAMQPFEDASSTGEACPYHMQVSVRRGGPPPQVPKKPQRHGSSVSSALATPSSAALLQQPNIPSTSAGAPMQYYTVLDPSEVHHTAPGGAAGGVAGWGAPPSPPLPPWPVVADATIVHPARRTPEEQMACASVNSEEGHASCQEIALRPARDGSQPKIDLAGSGGSSNSSWP